MNPKIERVREDIKKTEGKIKELDEYLKSLRIREKQLCDEELIKVMRNMAGKDGDVIALLDSFQKNHQDTDIVPGEKKVTEKKEDKKNAFSSAPDANRKDGFSESNDDNGGEHLGEKTFT